MLDLAGLVTIHDPVSLLVGLVYGFGLGLSVSFAFRDRHGKRQRGR